MYKKILTLLLCAALVFALSGCGNLFSREYLSVSSYTGDPGAASEAQKIADAQELKAAVLDMVSEHLSEEKFIFTAYDGDLQTDLAQLGWQIKSENALSGYSVEYLSYDLSRIVNYYEAKVQISYKRTAEEVRGISPASDTEALRRGVARALQGLKSHAAFRWTGEELTEDAAAQAVWQAFSRDPALCAATPETTIAFYYTGDKVDIISVDLDYGYDLEKLQDMKASLESAISAITRAQPGESEGRLSYLYTALSERCEYSPEAGASVYDALVTGSADSEGFALAMSALCHALDIDCYVVRGELYGEAHCWCIVSSGEGYVQLDPSGSFILRSDTQARSSGYRWNAGELPLCS